ncbi:cytochrome P450 [Infundibulicybe gibba]|nr:cytochrome P450 [Infundibulicybe gibba]
MEKILYSAGALALGFFLWKTFRGGKRANKMPLPPGPPAKPIIGNLWDLPKQYAWLHYAKMAETYGEIIHLNIFGRPLIILNSMKATTELLDKRSANYSDRPRLIMADELVGLNWDLAHMHYSDRWRVHRKTFNQYFQQRAIPDYHPVLNEATATLLHSLAATPEDFITHVRQHSGAIILRVVYGYDVRASHDHYVSLAGKAVQGLLQVVSTGKFLVDFLPVLKHVPEWMPGAGFKRKAKEWAQNMKELREAPFDLFKEGMARGNNVPCFVHDNLEQMKNAAQNDPEREEIIKNCAGIAYLAGADTTISMVLTWMLAMAHYPEVQRRAYEEMVAVVGKSRLPDFKDRPHLPYMEAMVTEALRWNPITPMAVPHRAVADDVYEGYLIPEGATVLGNAWAILHDPAIYPEPYEFQPERYLTEPKPPHPGSIGVFGFGRRACPGRYLGTSSGWIAIASILSAFHITKSVDANGKTVEPPIEYTDGLIVLPKPFKISITPRSRESLEFIRLANEKRSDDFKV